MNRLSVIGAAFAVLIFMTVGCTQPQEESIKIGVIATLTGPGAFQGQQEVRGLEICRDEINASGGVNGKQIELIIEDSKTDPATGVSAFKKLTEIDGVQFVIGDSWTSATTPLIPLANQQKVVLISPIALLDSMSQDDYFFRTIPPVSKMMTPLAQYAYNDLNLRRVGILLQENQFGVEHADDFSREFERLGGELVGIESFEMTSTDVRSEILKIKEKQPDGILNLHATGPMMGLLVKQAIELDVNVVWLGSFGAENQPLVDQYGRIIDGMVYPYAYDANDSSKSVQQFVSEYKKRFDGTPDITAANAYDALKVLAFAIQSTGENPSAVKTFFPSIQEFEGGSGVLSFDQNGDVQKPILIKRVQNQSFVVLKEE